MHHLPVKVILMFCLPDSYYIDLSNSDIENLLGYVYKESILTISLYFIRLTLGVIWANSVASLHEQISVTPRSMCKIERMLFIMMIIYCTLK